MGTNEYSMGHHLVSVIIPVYNVESYVKRCVESVQNQSYKNIEIILINDGSTDSSGDICNELSNTDNKIVVQHIENGGSSIARNYGVKIAKGAYISFVDSDDWISPGMIQKMMDYAIKNDLTVVECGSVRSSKFHKKTELSTTTKIEHREEAIKRIIDNRLFAVWRRIYHRSIIENILFLPNKIHQDVFYTIDILNKIDRIGYLNLPLYYYNIENNNSIIRGKYTLQKLNARDAALYLVENTKNYNEEIKLSAKKYLIKFLTFHYDSLFSNNNLDEKYVFRKEIKQTVKNHHGIKSFSFYGLLIQILPFWSYSLFLKVNIFRINMQVLLIKIFRYVKGK